MSSLFLKIFLLSFWSVLFSNLVALGWPPFNLSPGLGFTRVIYVMAVSSYFVASSLRDSRQLLFCFGRRSCRIGEELLMRVNEQRLRNWTRVILRQEGLPSLEGSASTQTQLVPSQKGGGLVKLGVTKLSPMSQIQSLLLPFFCEKKNGFCLFKWLGKKSKEEYFVKHKKYMKLKFQVHK